MEIAPLSSALGGEVKGVDLSQEMAAELWQDIHDVWLEYKVLVFRNQDLSEESHLRFAKSFGELQPVRSATHIVGDDQPFAGLVFKIMNDPYVGKLTFFRVYSGIASKGMQLYNPRTRKTDRLGRILQMHANTREEKNSVFSGDIAAAVGLKNATQKLDYFVWLPLYWS